jgi:hypothetical protein
MITFLLSLHQHQKNWKRVVWRKPFPRWFMKDSRRINCIWNLNKKAMMPLVMDNAMKPRMYNTIVMPSIIIMKPWRGPNKYHHHPVMRLERPQQRVRRRRLLLAIRMIQSTRIPNWMKSNRPCVLMLPWRICNCGIGDMREMIPAR